jgi:hypothetical protein
MGDPGSKAVLTLFNLIAEEEAFLRFYSGLFDDDSISLVEHLTKFPIGVNKSTFWRCFSCAGDDNIGLGPKWYHKRISSNHTRNGMCVDPNQTFVSQRGGFYCEEAILRTHQNRLSFVGAVITDHDKNLKLGFVKTTTGKYYFLTVHVDSLKIRLLSVFRKESGTGPNDSQEVNPAVGKGSHFLKKIQWMPPGFKGNVTIALIARWRDRMQQYIPDETSPYQYLPHFAGGLGFIHPLGKCDYEEIWKGLHPLHRIALSRCINGKANVWISRALSRFATNQAARGINLSNRVLEDEITLQLQRFDSLSVGTQVDGVTPLVTADVASEIVRKGMMIPPEEWAQLRHYDRKKHMSRAGFESINAALKSIERPYMFRMILSGTLPKMREFSLQPWKKRYASLIADLSRLLVDQMGRQCNESDQGFNADDVCVIDEKILNTYFRSKTEVYVRKESIPTECASLKTSFGKFGIELPFDDPAYPHDPLDCDDNQDDQGDPPSQLDGGIRELA